MARWLDPADLVLSPPPLSPLVAAAAVLLTIAPAGASEPLRVGGNGPPVILVTGPEADAGLYLWSDDAAPGRRGLAPSLTRRGFQVWIAAGDDLPAAVEHVLAAAGAAQVSLVGHGLGGTACYRYLARTPDPSVIERLVTLGAPFSWQPRSPLLEEVQLRLADPDVARYSQLAGRESGTTGGDLFAASTTALPPDRHPALLRRAREAGSIPHRAALDDLPGWVAGATDLATLEAPALVLCGGLDRIAPCEEAWRARDALGPTAAFHKLGYMNLDRLDYGHLDLVLTPEAHRRVFPLVARFLRTGRQP